MSAPRPSHVPCLLLAALVGATACQPSKQPPGSDSSRKTTLDQPAPKDAPAMPAPASIDWTMTKDSEGKALHIEYRVTNTSDRRIYLSDLVPTHTAAGWTLKNPQPIAVLNDDQPAVVRFARGRIASEAPLTVPPMDPGARAIDPGQTLQGDARVPLPLVATPYVGTVAPLRGKPTAARIELGFLRGDAHWSQLPLTDGSILTLSHATDRMEALRSEKKVIP